MKLSLIIIIPLLAITGIAVTFAYQQHKENERLKSGKLDFDDVENLFV